MKLALSIALLAGTGAGVAAVIPASAAAAAAAHTDGAAATGSSVHTLGLARNMVFGSDHKTGYLLGQVGGTASAYDYTFAAEATTDGGAHWTAGATPDGWDADATTATVDPADPATAWVLAYEQTSTGPDYGLLQTTDSGATWSVESDFGTDSVGLLTATEGGRLVALDSTTAGTSLITSDDGGKTWQTGGSVPSSMPGDSGRYAAWVSIAFTDNLHGVIGGSYITSADNEWAGYRLVTSDGGQTWTWQSDRNGGEVTDLHDVGGTLSDVVDPLSSSLGRPELSSDSGQTWQPVNLPAPPGGVSDGYYFNTISASWADPQHGWLLGQDDLGGNVLEYTADGGQTWARTALHGVGYGTIDALGTDTVAFGGADSCDRSPIAVEYAGQGTPSPTTTQLYGGAPYSNQMTGLDATDSTHAWAGAGCAGMTESTDGRTATTVDVHDGVADLTGIDFTSPQVGYASGYGRPTYTAIDGSAITEKTTDGGRTWSEVDNAPNEGLQSVSFADAQHGWAVGAVAYDPVAGMAIGGIRATTDAGATWSDISIPTPSSGPRAIAATDVVFDDAQHGWILGPGADANDNVDGVVMRTTDGGSNWTDAALPAQNITGYDGPHAMSWPTDSVGYVVGNGDDNAVIDTSTDGGATWTALTPPSDAVGLSAVSFISPQVGWVAGQGTGQDSPGAVWSTIDGGSTWTRGQLPPLTGTVLALKGISSGGSGQPTVWATSLDQLDDHNKLLRSADGGATFTQVSGPAPRAFLALHGATLTGTADNGQPVTATATLDNTGDADVTAPTATTTVPGAQLGGSCLAKLSIPAGHSCTVTITLPSPPEGLTAGTVSVFDNSAAGRGQLAGEQDLPVSLTSYGPGGVGKDTVVPTPQEGYGTVTPGAQLTVDGAGRPWFVDVDNSIDAPQPDGSYDLYQFPQGISPGNCWLVPGKGSSMWAVGYDGYAKLGPDDVYGGRTSTPWPNSQEITFASRPVFGPDGRLWGIDALHTDQVLAIDLTAGTVSSYGIGSAVPSGMTGDLTASPALVVAGSGLAALVSTTSSDYSTTGQGVVRIATDGTMTWQEAPAAADHAAYGESLAATSDGTAYLLSTDQTYSGSGFTAGVYAFPTTGSPSQVGTVPVSATGLYAAPDGSLWFTGSYQLPTTATSTMLSETVYGRFDPANGNSAIWPTRLPQVSGADLGSTGQFFLEGYGYSGNTSNRDLEQITTGAEIQPTGDSNGDLAYYDLTSGEFDTASFDGSTVGTAHKVDHLVRLNEDVSGLQWSPDGSRLLFARSSLIDPEREQAVYAVNPDGTGLTDLTMSTAGNSYDWLFAGATYTPDGSRVVLSRSQGSNSPAELVSVAADGSGKLATLLSSSSESFVAPAASSDGKHLAFEAIQQPGTLHSSYQLDISAADGSGRTALVGAQPGHYYDSPAFSPDGQTVYFIDDDTSGSTARSSIEAVPVSGGSPAVLATLPNDELSDLSVSPDGSDLLFTDFYNGHDKAMLLRVGDGSAGSARAITAANGDQELAMPAWQPVPATPPAAPTGTGTVTTVTSPDEYAYPDRGDRYTVRVTDGYGNAVTAGQVALFIDGTSIGQKALASDGTAAFADSSGRAVGDHSIVARYLGSGTDLPSDSSMLAEAVRHHVDLTVSLPGTVTPGQAVTGTVTVTPVGGDANYQFLGELTVSVDGKQQYQQAVTSWGPVSVDLNGPAWDHAGGEHAVHVEFEPSIITGQPDGEYGDAAADATISVATVAAPNLGPVTVSSPHQYALHFAWQKPTGGPVSSYRLTVGTTTVTLPAAALSADFGKGVRGEKALVLGRNYAWTLTALGSGGQSAKSGNAVPIGPPGHAYALDVKWHKVHGHLRAALQWTAPDDTRGRPWSGVAVSNGGSSWHTLGSSATAYTFTSGFTAGKKYTFHVRYAGPAGTTDATITSTAS